MESVLSSRNWKPTGEKMNENQGRFNQPGTDNYIFEIDSLLNALPAMIDADKITSVCRRLNIHHLEEQPTISLFYQPE